MTTLNWSDLIKEAGETASYEPLPDGDYDLVVLEGVAKQTQSGKTMFSVKAEVQGGPHNKRLVWDNLVVSSDNPTALGIFFSKMAALGLTRENFFNQDPTNAQIETALASRRFRAQVGSRVWQGNKKNEIKRYYPAQATTPSVAPSADPWAAEQAQAAPAPAPAPAAAPPAPF